MRCLTSQDNCQVPRNTGGIHLLVNVSGSGSVPGIARLDEQQRAERVQKSGPFKQGSPELNSRELIEMKRIECRRQTYFPILLALLLSVLFALTGCTTPEKARAEHASRGEAFLKAQKFQEASIEFRNAVQIDDKY